MASGHAQRASNDFDGRQTAEIRDAASVASRCMCQAIDVWLAELCKHHCVHEHDAALALGFSFGILCDEPRILNVSKGDERTVVWIHLT